MTSASSLLVTRMGSKEDQNCIAVTKYMAQSSRELGSQSWDLTSTNLADSEVTAAYYRIEITVAKITCLSCQACLEVGFFYLVNHGIAPSLLSAVLSQSKKFFAQSLEEKMEVLQDSNNRGYTPYGHETLDPQHQSRGDTKEGYHISAEISANDPRSSKLLHGPNKWPSPGTHDPPRHPLAKYSQRMVPPQLD